MEYYLKDFERVNKIIKMKSKKNCHTNDLMEISIDDCANVDDENKNNRIPSYVKKNMLMKLYKPQ